MSAVEKLRTKNRFLFLQAADNVILMKSEALVPTPALALHGSPSDVATVFLYSRAFAIASA
jgi:hypothetical protein